MISVFDFYPPIILIIQSNTFWILISLLKDMHSVMCAQKRREIAVSLFINYGFNYSLKYLANANYLSRSLTH